MSIVKEKFNGYSCNFTAEKREYTCTYFTRGVTQISEFPAYFRWECLGLSDPYARLIGLSGPRQLSKTLFEVSAKYSTLPARNSQRRSNRDQPANPLARAVVRKWSTGYLEINQTHDLDGVPYATSAGELYGEFPIRVPYVIKTFVRNEPYVSDDAILAYIWHTNSTRTILCALLEASEEMVDNDISYFQCTYQFWKLTGEGNIYWDEVRADVGSFYLDAENYAVYPEDESGTKALIPGAVWLDGEGGLGSPLAPAYNYFKKFPIAADDFAGLGLTI